MDFYSSMNIISSGLGAERVRMNATASNLANANTTRTEEGGPYKRRDPVFMAEPLNPDAVFGGSLEDALRVVNIPEIVEDTSPPRLEYDPTHPDANEEGYVARPNVQLVEEMVNMITASRAYEAGVTAMKSVVDMAKRTLTIGQ